MSNPVHGIRMSDETYLALQKQLMQFREQEQNPKLTMGDMLKRVIYQIKSEEKL